jgi:hypothetical protein
MHNPAESSLRRKSLFPKAAAFLLVLLASFAVTSCSKEDKGTGSEQEGSDLPLGTVRVLIDGVEYKTGIAKVQLPIRGDTITKYQVPISYGEAVIDGVNQEQVHMFLLLPDTTIGVHEVDFSEDVAIDVWPFSHRNNMTLIPRGQRYILDLHGYPHEFWAAGPTPTRSGFGSQIKINSWNPLTKEVSGTFS